MNINDILQLTDVYFDKCQNLVKLAKIRKLPNGKYRVLSEEGKNLGTYKSQEGAKKRLKQVEYFKHFDHSNIDDQQDIIDLTKIDEFAYSAIMRKMRKEASPAAVRKFIEIFKKEFDKAVKNKLHKPEKIALQNTMVKFNKIYAVKLDKDMIKNAAVAELGNAEQVGKYLSGIVKFTINRIPPDKRQHAIDNLKQKFSNLSEIEISSKQMPESSALGQSITFVKHVLLWHDHIYVKNVINSIIENL